MTITALSEKLASSGMFSPINLHFASFLSGRCGGSPEVFVASALVSRAASQGHVCIDLEELDIAGEPIAGHFPASCSDPSLWADELIASGAAGFPGDYAPLVLEKPSRLYLFRYWKYEKDLAESLLARADLGPDPEDPDITFPSSIVFSKFHRRDPSSVPDWQKVAACVALLKKLCVISGGPGTGKTTVVGSIISIALSACPGNPPRIALAAPTGKAAARLQEAVGQRFAGHAEGLRVPAASTIHRLLGHVHGSTYFRHDQDRQLPFDIVIVDEASMVDLPLMAKLVKAVPDRSRLVILGDRNQLSSVEAGAVLGDLCGRGDMNRFSRSLVQSLIRLGSLSTRDAAGVTSERASPLLDCVVELQESHRFREESGIGRVSREVRLGNGPEALNLLKSNRFPDITWKQLPGAENLAPAIAPRVVEFFGNIGALEAPEHALAALDRFRLLCALREGPYGVNSLNRLVEWILSEKGYIRPDQRWYRGRPVLITSNDYNLDLFNGDMGIILPDPSAGGKNRAFFRSAGGAIRSISPGSLPNHETVYAMTIHKSQGAEFDEALMVLPARPSPVLSRELVYTGITRARNHLEIWGFPEIFTQAVSNRTRRASGLSHRLWKR